MDNATVADILNRIAEMLEIKGENPFKVRAYQKAALTIGSLTKDIKEVVESDEIYNLPGIGESIALKIIELVNTGKLKYYEELEKEIPTELLSLLTIPGLGPKTIQKLWKELGITNKEQLKEAVLSGKLSNLKGFGKKTEENILKGLEQVKKFAERFPLGRVYPLAETIVKDLKLKSPLKQISVAGSIRRMKDTIGDIDILVTSEKPQEVMETFTGLPYFTEILAKGETKSSARTSMGIQVDIRVVDDSEYGAALYYFTGSKAHNIEVRKIAVSKGLKINEYGVFRVKDGVKIAGKTEEEVFDSIGLSYIPPEMRENTGEIELAIKGKLPKIVEISDIKGDLHVHTYQSDGSNTIEELQQAALILGYDYIAITDHSSSMGITGGMKAPDFLDQIKKISKLNKMDKKPYILSGVEVDIKSDCTLNLPDEVLKEFDIVIASIHTGFKESESQLTDRILSAIYNPYVNIIGHPTGRKIAEREAYPIDLDKIFKASAETGTILEVNSFWDRLDLSDVNCRKAKEMGVMIAISTDAHNVEHFNMMKFGVATARRGWLEKKDVLNTYKLKDLLSIIKNKKVRNN
ncbi:MAG: DNA polymerase/3'-5' exonuclease PolX [Caldisericia bacterium]|nr:DNA polymerase/3'-5' exonuclease PolX [Caldisericia bacterium]